MTDSNRKGRRGLWAWAVAWAMALASVLYMWSVFDSDTRRAESTAEVVTVPVQKNLRDVDAYRAFVASPGLNPSVSHEYTAAGIEHLADAIRAVADGDTGNNGTLASQREMFRDKADELRADQASRDHADIVKGVFSSAVDTLEYLQKTRRLESPSLRRSISDLRQLARDVDASEPLLRQQTRIRQFFEGSAQALYTLATAS